MRLRQKPQNDKETMKMRVERGVGRCIGGGKCIPMWVTADFETVFGIDKMGTDAPLTDGILSKCETNWP